MNHIAWRSFLEDIVQTRKQTRRRVHESNGIYGDCNSVIEAIAAIPAYDTREHIDQEPMADFWAREGVKSEAG